MDSGGFGKFGIPRFDRTQWIGFAFDMCARCRESFPHDIGSDVAAERKNLAFEQLRAEKEQTQEASKRLQMAGRDEQLRAAALSRTLRDTGDVSKNEFQFLSKGTKQNFQNFLPDKLPGDLNEVKFTFSKRRDEMDSELGQITGRLGTFRERLGEISDAITIALRKGGSLDVLPSPGKNPLPNLTGDRDRPSQVNLDVSGLNIRVDVEKGIRDVVVPVVEAAMARDMANLNTYLDQKYGRGGFLLGRGRLNKS